MQRGPMPPGGKPGKCRVTRKPYTRTHIMKTGTDCNLAECRASGYAVVAHGKRPLDPSKMYELTISNPNKWPNGTLTPGTRSRDAWEVNTFTSYDDLWKSFLRGGDGIKSFCDFENCPYPSPEESPTFNDFASLAQTVHMYYGLD